jgi:hypothetical protein
MNFKSTIAAAVMAVSASSLASAGAVDFTGGYGKTNTYSASTDGVGVDVTATRYGRSAKVTKNRGGLGVKGGVNHFQSIGRETMSFKFTDSVTLNSLTFDNRTWYDWTGRDKVHYTDSNGSSFTLSGSDNMFDIGADDISWFSLAAGGSWTSTFVAGLDYDPYAVPVPASAWLFGSALVGLAGLRRKKK